jgi:O-acetylhomoserine
MELEIYKPLEIEEALFKLKSSDAQFYVFNDIDAKMRVLYKRSDGKFGLY